MNHLDVANGKLMFVLCLCVIAFVVLQAVLFFKKAYGRGKTIGMETSSMKKVVKNTAVFTIIPALPILLFLLLLAPGLGMYFPWLRLSVIGSGMYENLIANTISTGAGFASLDQISMEVFIVIIFTMTLAIMLGPILTIFVLKPFSKKITELDNKKEGFGPQIVPTIYAALFIAIALPLVLPAVVRSDGASSITIPILAILAMIASSISVVSLTKISKKYDNAILRDFSFPLSIFVGMMVAIVASGMGVA